MVTRPNPGAPVFGFTFRDQNLGSGTIKMILKQLAVIVFLLILTDSGFGKTRTKRTHTENVALKVLREIDNVLHESKQNTIASRSAKESPSNCPTGAGIVNIQGTNTTLLAGNQGGLMNLMYMCGTMQEPYEVPARWVLHKGPNGTMINMTINEIRYRTVPLCCPGYIRNQDDICVPKCKGGCTNGLCVNPENCVCYQGYTLNSLGECVVTCPCGCPHGQCVGDVCHCESGYTLDGTNKVCNPVCKKQCVNADCIAPNNCTCWRGYIRKNKYVCEPHCSNGCEHGECTGADICVCHDGYYKEKNTGKCVPRCYGCEHGQCVAPYECHCHKGYVRMNDVCEPVCNGDCVNATCTAPDHCTCFQGYTRMTPNTCVPRCSPSCRNAQCVAPDKCECYSGYVKDPKPFKDHVCKAVVSQVIQAVGQIINGIRN